MCLRGVSTCACAHFKVHGHSAQGKNPAQNIIYLMGLCPKKKVEQVEKSNEWDVGMSHHEKEREQEDAYTKTESHS